MLSSILRFFVTTILCCCFLPSICSADALKTAQTLQPTTAPIHFATKARTKIIVGGGINMPPYEYLDEHGQPTGYNVEIMLAIAQVMGLEIEFKLNEWSKSREDLKNHRIDMLEGTFVTDGRADEFSFSIPHATVHHAIFSRKGVPNVPSIEELGDQKVIVHRGSLMHDYLIQKGWDKNLVLSDNPSDALRRIASGQYDYAVLPILPGVHLSQQLKLTNVTPISASIMATPYAFAVAKGDDVLLSQLNEGLAIIKQTGRYEEIYQKWLGVAESERINWQQLIRYGLWIVIPLLLVLSIFMLWSRTLHRQVAIRTADLEQEIKERKNVEEALRLNQQQLIQADKMSALGVLVSGVAHEINNPNGLILLNIPMLKRSLADIWDILEEHYQAQGDFMMGGIPYTSMRDEIPRMIEDTHNSAIRIKRIVEDLKNFSRSNNTSTKESVNLNVCVQTALRLLDSSIKKSTLEFKTNLCPNLPNIKGNAQQIEQVIVNLVLNASQALSDSSQPITITTRYDSILKKVILHVQDKGQGITPENLSKLTDPFFTTKRTQGGTGLGLSVSLRIMEEHGGALRFTSQPGQGTTATLFFPVEEQSQTLEF